MKHCPFFSSALRSHVIAAQSVTRGPAAILQVLQSCASRGAPRAISRRWIRGHAMLRLTRSIAQMRVLRKGQSRGCSLLKSITNFARGRCGCAWTASTAVSHGRTATAVTAGPAAWMGCFSANRISSSPPPPRAARRPAAPPPLLVHLQPGCAFLIRRWAFDSSRPPYICVANTSRAPEC
jgi:hypothetical protein